MYCTNFILQGKAFTDSYRTITSTESFFSVTSCRPTETVWSFRDFSVQSSSPPGCLVHTLASWRLLQSWAACARAGGPLPALSALSNLGLGSPDIGDRVTQYYIMVKDNFWMFRRGKVLFYSRTSVILIIMVLYAHFLGRRNQLQPMLEALD